MDRAAPHGVTESVWTKPSTRLLSAQTSLSCPSSLPPVPPCHQLLLPDALAPLSFPIVCPLTAY